MAGADRETCDLLIEAGFVVPVEPHGVVLEDHAVAVSDGAIVAVLRKVTVGPFAGVKLDPAIAITGTIAKV